MNSSTPAADPRVGSSRRRRAHHLAALPDPREQARLEEQGVLRSRERLAEAEADGHPLVDRSGRRRPLVTLPEYRKGRAPTNKGRRFPIETLTREEVCAILDAMPRRGATAARNRALVVVLYRVGLRIAEALALFPKDVDLELGPGGAIAVLEGKGSKRRIAAMDPSVRPYLEAWLAERDLLGAGPHDSLFCVTRGASIGEAMYPSGATGMLKAYGRKAGITKRVYNHGLRHTCAKEMGLEGVPVPLIQEQLGHDDLSMTQHYIGKLLPSDLLRRIGERSWPGEPPAQPMTAAALSGKAPVPSPPPPVERHDPPEPRRVADFGRRAATGQAGQRVLDVISANGGSATQGQLRRALGISQEAVLRQMHRLHDDGLVIRAGLDRHRSIIWKLAPPKVVMSPGREYRQAPRGEGPRRVLDAIDALGGRASQAELARALDLQPHTVHEHCLTLLADGRLERGGLDKSTSRRGSQVWCMPAPRPRLSSQGGYTMQVRLPAR
jgi:integrase/DNA-binding Lrp family transcriptional regulator